MIKHIFNQTRLLRAPSNLVLNVSRDGASTTSLGNPFQSFTTPTVKNFFLITSLNLPSLSLKPSPLVLSQQALLKRLSSSFLQAPFRYRTAFPLGPLVHKPDLKTALWYALARAGHPGSHAAKAVYEARNRPDARKGYCTGRNCRGSVKHRKARSSLFKTIFCCFPRGAGPQLP